MTVNQTTGSAYTATDDCDGSAATVIPSSQKLPLELFGGQRKRSAQTG
jgi:hypothetical protein